jgi:hypothetical protein
MGTRYQTRIALAASEVAKLSEQFMAWAKEYTDMKTDPAGHLYIEYEFNETPFWSRINRKEQGDLKEEILVMGQLGQLNPDYFFAHRIDIDGEVQTMGAWLANPFGLHHGQPVGFQLDRYRVGDCVTFYGRQDECEHIVHLEYVNHILNVTLSNEVGQHVRTLDPATDTPLQSWNPAVTEMKPYTFRVYQMQGMDGFFAEPGHNKKHPFYKDRHIMAINEHHAVWLFLNTPELYATLSRCADDDQPRPDNLFERITVPEKPIKLPASWSEQMAMTMRPFYSVDKADYEQYLAMPTKSDVVYFDGYPVVFADCRSSGFKMLPIKLAA